MSRPLCAENKKTRLERPLRRQGSRTNKQEVEPTAGAEMLHHVSSPLFQSGGGGARSSATCSVVGNTKLKTLAFVWSTMSNGIGGGGIVWRADPPVTKPLQQVGRRLHGAK